MKLEDLNTKDFYRWVRIEIRGIPCLRGSALAVTAADEGDKEVIRLMVESRANVCSP